jgi:thermitase
LKAAARAALLPSQATQAGARQQRQRDAGRLANGITYAADHGAKVINLSLGGGGSTTLQNAVDYAWSKGAFLACAAVNDNTSSTASADPGAYGNCFAVASTNSSDARSLFSNYGSWVEAAAPG